MKKLTGVLLSVAAAASLVHAVQFEAPKDTSGFDGVEVKIGAGLTFNFQVLDNDYTPTTSTTTNQWIGGVWTQVVTPDTERELQAGFILPQADLDISAKLLSGFNVYLKTMLSSHHHNETYVQGGYVTIDNLDFITPGFLSSFMDDATIKMGVYMPDIGDDYFTRSTNAEVFNNPFINNTAVELYMNAPFVEVLYRMPFINTFVVLGYTTGQVNPTDVAQSEGSSSPMWYGKIGYDIQLSDALRVRLAESVVHVSNTNTSHNSLFSGDKGGDTAALVYGTSSTDNRTSGWKPFSFNDLSVSMTNLFLQFYRTELSAMYQYADGSLSDVDFNMNHYTAGVVQRFGMDDKFYAAARYEYAIVKTDGTPTDQKLTQSQIALGWFLSENAMAKVEYIDQKRENFSDFLGDAKFSGYMIQAALRF